MNSFMVGFKKYGPKCLKTILFFCLSVVVLFAIAPYLSNVKLFWTEYSIIAKYFKYLVFLILFVYWDSVVEFFFSNHDEVKKLKSTFILIVIMIEGLTMIGRYS